MKLRLLPLTILLLSVQLTAGQPLSMEQAVALAEKFIAENGYTDLPPSKLKAKLDPEPIESSTKRSSLIKIRFNTLIGKAIGASRGGRSLESGWSVAFDYRNPSKEYQTSCRVVTMAVDGSNIHLVHQEGIREYFVGFKP